jgi:hypothetical protein
MLVGFLLVFGLSAGMAVVKPTVYKYTAVLAHWAKLGIYGVQLLGVPECVLTSFRDAFHSVEPGSPRFTKHKLPKIDASGPKTANLALLNPTGVVSQGALISKVMKSRLDHLIEHRTELIAAQTARIHAGGTLRIEAIDQRVNTLKSSLATSGQTGANKAMISGQLQALEESEVNLQQSLQEALAALQLTKVIRPPQRGGRVAGSAVRARLRWG